MTEWSLPRQQGVSEAVNLLKGKWTLPVLAALALGERQNKDILTSINAHIERNGGERNALSHRVLTDTLQRATEDKLIERNAEEGTFGAVRYRLTTKGRSLLQAVRPLAEWALQYYD
ncbi:winged helix-turn-helix transcriptional regulator [Kibdelosporangium aridum]|uniref:winged helix-turn-helix transcriptional regulator n=1 Tax=Kibdelosporangium aridum TaxID=2030 RepID=UPI0005256517